MCAVCLSAYAIFCHTKIVSKNIEKTIFKSSQAAYFWSGRLLPKGTRDDVFKLYSFLHTVRQYAMAEPAAEAQFVRIIQRWATIKLSLKKRRVPTPLDDSVDEHVLANIAYVVHRHNCDPDWVDAFLDSMKQDMQKHSFKNTKEQQAYIYGASEVAALFMARILNLPEEALKPARMQARAIAYVDFLRHIAVHNKQGRCYFAQTELKKYGLKNIGKAEALAKPAMFTEFVHAQLLHYATSQAEANMGMLYVPKRYRATLQIVTDTYAHMAEQIKTNPMIIYEQDLLPQRLTLVQRLLHHKRM